MRMSIRHGASTSSLLMRLLHDYGRQHAPTYAVAFVLMAAVAGCTSISAWLMKDLINTIFVAHDAAAMMFFPAVVSGLFITKGILAYFQEITLASAGRKIVTDLQKRMYAHFLRMDLSYFRLHNSA